MPKDQKKSSKKKTAAPGVVGQIPNVAELSERQLGVIAMSGHQGIELGIPPMYNSAVDILEAVAQSKSKLKEMGLGFKDALLVRKSNWDKGDKKRRDMTITKEQAGKWFRSGMYHLDKGNIEAALNCHGLLSDHGAWYQANQLRDAIKKKTEAS